eukprot:7363767-Prymnesium_polylepis.1
MQQHLARRDGARLGGGADERRGGARRRGAAERESSEQHCVRDGIDDRRVAHAPCGAELLRVDRQELAVHASPRPEGAGR